MNANEMEEELQERAPERQQAAISGITSSPTPKQATDRTAEDIAPKDSPANTEPSAALSFLQLSEEFHDDEVWPVSRFARDS
jgi:hypothetical protein